jgi:hypothetical protein
MPIDVSSLSCTATCRYHALLRTAKERGTVTYVSNLFDTFFAGGKDHRTRVSAANMPYLEGVRCVENRTTLMHLCQLLNASRQAVSHIVHMQCLCNLTDFPARCSTGDYWPGEAENLLLGIAEEARQAGKRAGKGAGSKANPANRGGKKVQCNP